MFNGYMPALVTPFRNGALDLETLKKLVDWHIAEGTNGFVPVGTTGESPTLSHAEHDTVVRKSLRPSRAGHRLSQARAQTTRQKASVWLSMPKRPARMVLLLSRLITTSRHKRV